MALHHITASLQQHPGKQRDTSAGDIQPLLFGASIFIVLIVAAFNTCRMSAGDTHM